MFDLFYDKIVNTFFYFYYYKAEYFSEYTMYKNQISDEYSL